MLKGVSIELRDVHWHKRHMKKKLRREAIRKAHDFEYRVFQGHSRQVSEAEKNYQEAMEREAKILLSKNWFVRQFIKLKFFIKRKWIRLNSKRSK